jgi:phosphoglycolate phosphatase
MIAYGGHIMAIRLVIFDLDGTLVDTLQDLADSMNAVLAARGHPTHGRDPYRRFVGDGVAELVRRALPPEAADEVTVAECVAEMREEYGRRLTAASRPYPGIEVLLAALRARGLKTAVLSNKPDPATRTLVAMLFPDHRFHAVRGARPGVALKPDPEAASELCAGLGVDPRRTLYVGDTDTDMATGRAAGMVTVGVAWGFRDPDELLRAGAEHLVHRPDQLLALCGEGSGG